MTIRFLLGTAIAAVGFLLASTAHATPSFEATPGIQFEFATDYYGEALYQGGVFGSIGVSGTGADSFTIRETFQFTNTTGQDQTFIMGWEYWIGGTAEADPTQGETLTYGWDIGFVDLFPPDYEYGIFESQDHVCSPTEQTVDWSCNAYYDFNEGHESLFFLAGETKTFDLLMDFYASAESGAPATGAEAAPVSVPEPATLPILLTALGAWIVARGRRWNL